MSLFHVQIQQPQEDLSFLQNLLIFFITKYLKQEVDNDLSVYVDGFSSCGLSITGDIKIYQWSKWSKVDDVTTPKFDN